MTVRAAKPASSHAIAWLGSVERAADGNRNLSSSPHALTHANGLFLHRTKLNLSARETRVPSLFLSCSLGRFRTADRIGKVGRL
jgi:hypothetical protein